MTHPETTTRTFLTLRITPFIRATLVVAAVLSIVGSCRVINGEVQEHRAWRRYEALEREIGIRRGMERAALVAALEARGVECGVQGDPERPADKYPPQVLWAVVAKWEGPVFGEELGLEADIDATGRIVACSVLNGTGSGRPGFGVAPDLRVRVPPWKRRSTA